MRATFAFVVGGLVMLCPGSIRAEDCPSAATYSLKFEKSEGSCQDTFGGKPSTLSYDTDYMTCQLTIGELKFQGAVE